MLVGVVEVGRIGEAACCLSLTVIHWVLNETFDAFVLKGFEDVTSVFLFKERSEDDRL